MQPVQWGRKGAVVGFRERALKFGPRSRREMPFLGALATLGCPNSSVTSRQSESPFLSGRARKFLGGHAARGWAGSCSDSGVWLSSLFSRSSRSMVVNFHLNGRAVWL